jgi:putative transposase
MLSSRQLQTAYSQAKGSFESWLTHIQNEVRSFITYSSLDDHTKTILYRINARKEWYNKKLSLPWLKSKDGLVLCSKRNKNHIMKEVSDEHMKLIRALVKQAKKLRSRPNLLKVKTLVMDAKIAVLENGKNSFPYWLRLSTLTKGKPIYLPLTRNPFLEKEKNNGRMLNFVQLTFLDDNTITIAPIIEQENAQERKYGDILGLDWGVKSLFGTSDGQLLGMKMLNTLKEWDKIIMTLQADLQRQNLSLKNNAKYQLMQKRINSYVKNEVGRLLNKLAVPNIREIAVEKLDFRHGGLSKSMNRLISRAGRNAVEAKLSRLKETHGITITHVNAAYTSQQCNKCGFVDKNNRKKQEKFVCLCCGYKLHADINAARNIKERRSLLGKLNEVYDLKTRKNLREKLLEVHSLKCPSGKHLATARNVGLVETVKAV